MSRIVAAAAVTLASLLLGTPAHSSADQPQPVIGGFRMASDPKIETVFGDTTQFKHYIDRFLSVHDEMQRTHEDFSRNAQAVLTSIEAYQQAGGAPGCPVDAVALAYARAFRLGQRYHTLGKELESLFVSLRDLDELGETRGLTPDYRWKVARSLKLYDQVLSDFREMRISFETQLSDELKFQGCDPQRLITKGDEIEKAGAPPAPAPSDKPKEKATGRSRKGARKMAELPPPVRAAPATFIVDNGSCPSALRVFLDGTLLGDVASNAKAAFRAPMGRHDLCLMQASSRQRCGDAGTVRRTYIHDGWSIALRCD